MIFFSFVGIQSVQDLVWQSSFGGWLNVDCVRKMFNILLMVSSGGGCDVEMLDTFHVLLYSNDSILNGFDRMLIFGAASLSPLLSRPSVLSRRVMEQSSGSLSSSSLTSPTTSIWISSSSKSDSLLIRCCAKYSAFNVSMSTVIPLARSLRAWRSNALANFFLRRALSESQVKMFEKERDRKQSNFRLMEFFFAGWLSVKLNWTKLKPKWAWSKIEKKREKTINNQVNNVFTVLLLSIRSVEWAHRSMTADVHYGLVGQVLSLCAPSFATWLDDFETKPKQEPRDGEWGNKNNVFD